MFLKSLSIMEVKVTIGTTPELTGLAVAVTNLINGQTSFSLGEAVKDVIGKTETAKDEVEDEKPAKEEKPKATRTRTKKEEPGVQEPPKKEEVEDEDEKPTKEEKPKKEVKEDETESGAITIGDIRKVQRKVSLGGGIEKMKDLLATFGVDSASELKKSDYDAYYEKLVELV